MSTNPIISIRDLDINRISFVQGNAKANRIPSINIKYDGQNLTIRLPRMTSPFGISESKDGPPSYSLAVSLKGCDPYGKARGNSDDIGQFYNFLMDLESKIIDSAVENSGKWLPLLHGKKRSEQNIRENIKSLVKLHMVPSGDEKVASGKYPPTIGLKVPVHAKPGEALRVQAEIVDARKNPIYVTPSSLKDVFTAGVEANLVVSPTIYVMASGSFGVTWRISLAQVFPQARMTAAVVFADETDEVEENDDMPIAEPLEAPATPVTAARLDVEIPDLDGDASAPAPPAPRKRRAVPSS